MVNSQESTTSVTDTTRTAIVLLIAGLIMLPVGIVSSIGSVPILLAAPLCCIALAVAIFAKQPKAVGYIFIVNLVLECGRLVYYFCNCFQCYKLVSETTRYGTRTRYVLDDVRLAALIILSVSCLALIVSNIIALYRIFYQGVKPKKEHTPRSNSPYSVKTDDNDAYYPDFLAWSLILSFLLSTAAFIVLTVGGYDELSTAEFTYVLPYYIVTMVFNVIIGIMTVYSFIKLFDYVLPELERQALTKQNENPRRKVSVSTPSVPTNPPASRPISNVADEILKYKQLLDMGAITQEEFDEAKKKLLSQSL